MSSQLHNLDLAIFHLGWGIVWKQNSIVWQAENFLENGDGVVEF